jgi:glycosyltransferase involved in cell wall biosynthesis
MAGDPRPTKPAESAPTVELVPPEGPSNLKAYLESRSAVIDLAFVSRHHNLQLARPVLDLFPEIPVIYDAEGIWCLHDRAAAEQRGEIVSDERLRQALKEELRPARNSAALLAVSKADQKILQAEGFQRTFVVSHAVAPSPTPAPHGNRDSLLFVGAFSPESPNADAVLWFCKDILPKVATALPSSWRLLVVGNEPPEQVRALASERVKILGRVEELEPLYSRALAFIAPVRFSTGISLKLPVAAAHGVPIVCTTQLAEQLGWRNGLEVLAGDHAEEFAEHCRQLATDPALWIRLRDAALARVRNQLSRDRLQASLADSIDAALGAKQEKNATQRLHFALGEQTAENAFRRGLLATFERDLAESRTRILTLESDLARSYSLATEQSASLDQLRRALADLDTAMQLRDSELVDATTALEQRARELADLTAALDSRDDALTEQLALAAELRAELGVRAHLAEKLDRELASEREALNEHRAELARREREIAALDDAAGHLRRALDDRTARLDELLSSRTWRMTSPFRRILAWVLRLPPPAS